MTTSGNCLATDLTEQKKSNDVLRESEEKYRNLFELAPDGIVTLDLEGVARSCNSAALRLLGYSREEIVGKHFSKMKFFSPKDMNRFTELFGSILSGGGPSVVETTFTRKDGSTGWSENHIGFLEENGKRVGLQTIFTDITKRKEAEVKLLEYADKLENIVDERTKEIRFLGNIAASINQAVIAQDNNRRIVYANKAFEEMYGYSMDEIMGKDAPVLFPSTECADEVHLEITRGLEKEGMWLGEMLRKRKNGEIFTALVWVSYLRDEKGRVIGRLSLSTDITEKKEIERRFQLDEERLRRIFENAPIGIVVTDEKGNYLDVNEEECRLAKASREELLKLNFHNLVDETTLPFYEKAMRGEACEYVGPYHTTIRGLDIWLRMIFAPIFGAEKEIVGVMCLNEDITEKKELERKLQSSEERLREILNNVPVSIIMTDAKGNYIEVNETQCRKSQVTREELLKQNYFNQRDKSLQPFFKRALQGEVTENEGFYTTTARGITYYARTIFAPVFGIGGEISGVAILSEDMTEKKKLEEQLLEQTRLASIGATALMVGHDLRNPLQAMVNNLFLSKKKLDTMPNEIRKYLEESGLAKLHQTIADQVYYMNKIVSDLQDYARPLNPKLVETDFSMFIDDVLSTVNVPENVNVSKMVGENYRKVMFDPELMRRAFINLVTNAVQAMPNGGKLIIRASEKDGDVLLSVEDTGVGISEENLGKLFQPLFTTKAKGQGMGLAVSRRIVEAHGGRIMVDSEQDKGSIFTVSLPKRLNDGA
jgi:PAS domain S-box-containing protein